MMAPDRYVTVDGCAAGGAGEYSEDLAAYTAATHGGAHAIAEEHSAEDWLRARGFAFPPPRAAPEAGDEQGLATSTLTGRARTTRSCSTPTTGASG